jgi:hypothetical protein
MKGLNNGNQIKILIGCECNCLLISFKIRYFFLMTKTAPFRVGEWIWVGGDVVYK